MSVRPISGILLTVFGMGQTYDSARRIPADMLLEMVESKLDESLGMLEGDAARRARAELQIVKEFGTWSAFMQEAEKHVEDMPEPGAILPAAPSTSS